MIDLTIKMLIVLFALAVGSSFTFWPEKVSQRFDQWRRQTVELSGKKRGSIISKAAKVIWFRQIGVLLIALTCYAIYLWIRTK